MSMSTKPDSVNSITCQHCAGPLTKDMETSRWTMAPFVHDSLIMIGSAVGGTTSAFYGYNCVMPVVQKWIRKPMWLQYLVGAPPLIVFSSACAGLAGGAFPALTQLAFSSYYAVKSSLSRDDKKHLPRNTSAV